MPEQIQFTSRVDFRKWLEKNYLSDNGIWLVFGKNGGSKTLKAGEALEEALYFGWIDGKIESIDDKNYKKYFKKRRKMSRWSEKNKNHVHELEMNGLMTEYGRVKIEEAKQSGMWDTPKPEPLTVEYMQIFEALLKNSEPKTAYSNFMAMSPSAKGNYVGSYFSIKTEDGKKRKLQTIIERLNQNLNTMERMK